jgi:hypothetical protein
MASNVRDQPELAAAAPAGRDGRDGRDGVTAARPTDPAHTGPLPEATLPELVGRVITDVSDLADRQIDLAKQEIAEAKSEAISAVIKIALGAGIAVAAALLLVIWAWTAFIWFFNWVGAFITIGPVTFAWIGWLLGVLVPALAAFIAYRMFIRQGIKQVMGIWPPLARTRATLREDLEWLRQLRTRSAR